MYIYIYILTYIYISHRYDVFHIPKTQKLHRRIISPMDFTWTGPGHRPGGAAGHLRHLGRWRWRHHHRGVTWRVKNGRLREKMMKWGYSVWKTCLD